MSPDSPFERAADAIVSGDLPTVRELAPALIHARSERPHHATLLHYVSANGVEDFRQKTPPNIVEIAALLLDLGADPDALCDAYGQSTALTLVASSVHPHRAGVQLALIDLLLDRGASIDGPGACRPVNAALANGRGEAAAYLARRGAALDFGAAAGVGRLSLVDALYDAAPERERLMGFLWACQYGRKAVVEQMLGRAFPIDAQDSFGMTGLHWAIAGGRYDTVRLLLSRGAPIDIRNQWGGDALGQAYWSAETTDAAIDYRPIIDLLRAAGARE